MIKAISPPSLAPPFAAYSHAVLASGLLVTSGQLAVDTEGQTPSSAEDQARLILRNLDAILYEAGMIRANVLRLNAYVTARDHMAGYMAARDDWVAGLSPLPASTLMIVSGFTRPEFLVEIEMIAQGDVHGN